MGIATGPAGGGDADPAPTLIDRGDSPVVTDSFLGNIMRASVNPYAVLDEMGVVRFVSEPIVHILGLTDSECVGRNVMDFIAPEHRDDVATAIAEFLDPHRDEVGWTGPPISVDLLHVDGRRVPCRVLGVGSGNPEFRGIVVRIRQTSTAVKLDHAMAGMVTSRDLDTVCGLLLDVLAEQMPGSTGVVGLGWTGSRFTHTIHPDGSPRLDGDFHPVDDDALPWVAALATGEIHAAADLDELPRPLADVARRAGYVACWCFPVALDGVRDSVLVVWRRMAGAPTLHLREATDRLVRLIQLAWTAQRSRLALEEQARTDPLTGLANRLGLFDRLEELGRTHPDATIGLLYCDLDDFKPINDRFGHGTGDRVLSIAAHRISSQVRAGDMVARLGGDEFAVLCLATDRTRLAGLARRLVRSFEEPIAVDGESVRVGLSVGSAILGQGWHTRPSTSVLHDADSALLDAKASGKGIWRSASA